MKDVHPATMKLVPEAEIDLRGWLLFENGHRGHLKAVNDWLAESVTNTLRDVFEEHPPQIEFPIAWSPDSDGRRSKTPQDPAMVYISLPLGATEDDNVVYACSLEGAIDDLIEMHEDNGEGSEKVSDPDAQGILRSLSARLRELADKLDAACVEGSGK